MTAAPTELPDTVESPKMRLRRPPYRLLPTSTTPRSSSAPTTVAVWNAARLAPPAPAIKIGSGHSVWGIGSAQLLAVRQRFTASAKLICRVAPTAVECACAAGVVHRVTEHGRRLAGQDFLLHRPAHDRERAADVENAVQAFVARHSQRIREQRVGRKLHDGRLFDETRALAP